MDHSFYSAICRGLHKVSQKYLDLRHLILFDHQPHGHRIKYVWGNRLSLNEVVDSFRIQDGSEKYTITSIVDF